VARTLLSALNSAHPRPIN